MPSITVEEFTVPATVDAPDAGEFIASVGIVSDLEAEGYGHDELRLSPSEVLPWWQDPASPRRLFGVKIDGRVVARGMLDRLIDDPNTAWLMVGVRAEHRGQGFGTAIADRLEELAREEGRSKLIAYVVSKDAAGPRLESPTGFGSVPADNPEVRFLLARGYALQQVVRGSRLALPVELQVGELDAAYRMHNWEGRTPERWQEDIAQLHTRMSTDAPSAGLEEPEDVFTVERLVAIEEAHATSPRASLTTAVEHVPSGHLVGFTVLSAPVEPARAVHQDDTLVLSEHRGKRLGMLLKAANLEYLQQSRPGHPSVLTFNAEENRNMLSVNEAIGFVPVGYEGAWRKDL